MAALPQTLTELASDAGDEVLSQSDRTRVVRRRQHGRHHLVVKQGLSGDSVRRLRNEADMLRRLDGVEGVARLVPLALGPDVLAMVDHGGVALAQLLREERLGLADVLHIGLGLARILAAVHRRGVVHRDINPANIVVVGAQRHPVLIDFDIASSCAEEAPSFTHQSDIAGTLAYMAPEQTGRTGRCVDQRADLYALGATLYEMCTGRVPFDGDDPLQLIHDHLVRPPVVPAELVPGLPPALSDIVMRLLEKESDRRYQSADGLAHDLAHLTQLCARGQHASFALGERDFAARLLPPSRLVGRDAEVAALRDAFDLVLQGRPGAVLVAGAPGVGKTALINELRPMATASRGWFVSGKFDQSRRDSSASAILQALRALGRLLLSQPEDELARLRVRLAGALGSNAGLVADVLPEFSVLLDASGPRVETDPLNAEARLFQAGIALLRTLASPERPVVMVIDDLQWAGAASAKFLDALVSDESLQGLLLVGAYRPGEVDAAHPLASMMARWEQQGRAPARLSLANLQRAALASMLREMLRLDESAASELAQAVGSRTEGNPFDTVELVNALRHDGALRLGEHGWQWEASAIRQFVGQGEVVDLLRRRLDRLPAKSRELLSTMACLSGEMELPLLQQATGLEPAELDARLAAPLEDGLLMLDRSGGGPLPSLRFRHDRVQQTAYACLDDAARLGEHLALARRLAASPQWAPLAAEQYLLVADALDDPRECREVALLFKDAALRTMGVNYTLGDRLLCAGIAMLSRVETASDQAELVALRTHRVFTLYCLGLHDELDAVYGEIEARCADPMQLAEAASMRITSLTTRGRHAEAVALGGGLLQRLDGCGEVAVTDQQAWDDVVEWAGSLDLAADLLRPEVSDPNVLALISVLSRYAHAAYFCGPAVLGGAVHRSMRLWRQHGPARGLMSALSQCPVVSIGLHHDYRTGYHITRHTLLVAQSREYEPQTSQIRGTMGMFAQHWFEPLENCLRNLAQAREQLLMGGSMTTASFAYNTSLLLELECAQTLDVMVSELDAAEGLARRVGNVLGSAAVVAFRQFARAMRGETEAPGSFNGPGFDEDRHLAGPCAHPVPAAAYHVTRGLAAAVFGDLQALARSASSAMASGARQTNYRAACAHLLQGLALAQRLQAGGAPDAPALAAELDTCCAWMAARAEDAPGNYLYMQHWLEAERAWAQGEGWEATRLFNIALGEVAASRRPLHHALMLERCALLQAGEGMHEFSAQLLVDATQGYRAWGASAKVEQLLARHESLRPRQSLPTKRDGRRSTGVSSEQIDMLAILRASQALSSETSLDRLQASVNQLLISLTGATRVTLVLRGDDAEQWSLPPAPGQDGPGAQAVPVQVAAAERRLPFSAFRYAQRTREPLLVEDATVDDRFAADHYFTGMERCSLLAVPIQSQGDLRAVLLLENHQSRGAFAAHRLDAVNLIAGQLAVSLDNAMLYASLARKVAERTEALEQANRRLELLAITDGLTGLANRRRFNEVLETEWKRALRTRTPIGLAMIDIDQFKLYNDHYGHLGGDACLRRVASVLSSGQRVAADLAARYGGEEFALVLPSTDLAGTQVVAERLRRQVQELQEPHALAMHRVVTISVGIASFVPSDDSTPAQWLEVADAALYQAKHHGRNQVWGQEACPRSAEAPGPGGTPSAS